MSIYSSNQINRGMDNVANAVLLGSDLHLAFDELKGVGSTVRLAISLVNKSKKQLLELHHNRPLSPS